ncbi:MAG: heterocyst differentiation protein HetZ [Leptolyngbyaceae cyanobacterium RU_5_1]|nr:heterocyst differentiation protein HetZ [Leptolyngbyaceae cyanobacterium RU_5_1]
MGEIRQSVEAIFQLLLSELKLSTNASEQNCRDVAERLSKEVIRICSESKRIQASGDAESWAFTLAKHRLQQCLQYYKLGSRRGRVELHSTLSAVIYRYITPPQTQSSYQARLPLIEDFLQGFYMEALNAFRRETQLPPTYQPRTLLELSEYMAFTERYGKRRIPLPGHRTQQLIILRAQTFSQQQPTETPVDIEQAAEGMSGDSENSWNAASMQQVREQMVAQEPEPAEDTLRHTVIAELIAYLDDRNQADCADYFTLRLQDMPASEIESILGLTSRQRDYLQQRFKYHLIRFALSHRWELVHQWLEADLERNLGLTPQQWQTFQSQLDSQQQQLLQLKQQKRPDAEIAQALGCTVTQVQKQWFKLLEHAWEIRNYLISGAGASTNE